MVKCHAQKNPISNMSVKYNDYTLTKNVPVIENTGGWRKTGDIVKGKWALMKSLVLVCEHCMLKTQTLGTIVIHNDYMKRTR